MSRPSKEERLQAVHNEALLEFDGIMSAVQDEREQCLEDRRFYSIAGAQWEGPLGEQFENKPKFEVNKVHLAVIRIINEYRNNRITVNFVSKAGAKDDDLADLCDGLYRADEERSDAEEAYDNAFEEACAGGFGAWRLRAEYEDDEDDEDEKQRICIEPIFDADSSVFFGLGAKRQDKADAKSCYVLTSMTVDAYRNEWGDDPASWPKDIERTEFDWNTPDVVYVAEYYRVEEVREAIHVWKFPGEEGEERYTDDELEENMERLLAVGGYEDRVVRKKKRRVRKYVMSGGKVLEDCGYIAGCHIPVIPVYGKRWFVDNVERCMGHVRLAKDPQRLKNMQLSKLGEISALSSVEKPILTPEQIAGHQMMWSEDNVKNYPYLLVNPITGPDGTETVSGPIGYTKPPMIPPALGALLQITDQDLQDLLGNQQEGEQLTGNISTQTAELIQTRLDMQTYIYMSNMAKAMRRCGEVWLSMAREIFVEPGRQMKTVGMQGETDHVELMRPTIRDGETAYENDLSRAKMDVVVEVGPSSSTKRSATVRSLTAMLGVTTDPETQMVLTSAILMNTEGEGIGDIRRYFRKKLLRMGVVEPTDDEREELIAELQNQEPDAQTKYFEAAAAEAQTDAVKNQAEAIRTQAQADRDRAETAKTLAEIDKQQQEQAIEVIKEFGPRVVPPSVPGSEVQE